MNGRRSSDRITGGRILAALLGGLFLLGGCALFGSEVLGMKRAAVLVIGFAVAVFGAGLLEPNTIFQRLRDLANAASGFLPWAPRPQAPFLPPPPAAPPVPRPPTQDHE